MIGCGRIGTAEPRQQGVVVSHAQAYRAHPRTELVGLADVDVEALARARRAWSVPAENEPSESDPIDVARRLAPDIVSLCTPDDTHAELALRLLEVAPPRALFLEKPMALTGADARKIRAAATRTGTIVCIDHTRRFSPAFAAVREELAAGRHGRPLLARVLYTKGLLHNGVHAIDLLRWWLGEPRSATGRVVGDDRRADPAYDAELGFDGGFRARLDASDHRAASLFELDLLTEHARIRFWDGGTRWEFSRIVDSRFFPGHRTYEATGRERSDPLFVAPLATCLRSALDDLVASLDGGPPPRCGVDDGVAAVEWADRIRQSV